MDVAQEILSKRQDILRLASRHGARNVRLFGSVARGQAGPQSDVDFLVDMEPGRTLLDLGGLLYDLRELLQRPVDMVTEKSLKERVRHCVLDSAVPL